MHQITLNFWEVIQIKIRKLLLIHLEETFHDTNRLITNVLLQLIHLFPYKYILLEIFKIYTTKSFNFRTI